MSASHVSQKKKFRKTNELARRKAKKSPYATIAIICEDSKSSPSYFNKLKSHFRLNTANVIIASSKGSAPINVVNHAIGMTKNTPEIDYVACVFDRDTHESYERAINKLDELKSTNKNKSIYWAITSTPCYEIWLLLHFCYTTKSYHASGTKSAGDNLIADLCNYLNLYKKNTTTWFSELINKLDAAIKNAKQLQEHNFLTKSTNPSTNMHILVEFLIRLKK
ncbi:MAG TPA: RloB family protein [Gammaproteobacteria bacterium]|nr:RloB family protein [Gammaproteobacteria bacterium]